MNRRNGSTKSMSNRRIPNKRYLKLPDVTPVLYEMSKSTTSNPAHGQMNKSYVEERYKQVSPLAHSPDSQYTKN